MARHHLLVPTSTVAAWLLLLPGCGSGEPAAATSDPTGPTASQSSETSSGNGELTTEPATTGVPTSDGTMALDSSSEVGTTANPVTSSTDPTRGDSSTGDPSVCGDGVLAHDEGCDDANLVDFDGCSAACRVEIPASAIWVGAGTACATFEDATLRCWGGGAIGTNGSESMNSIGDEPGEMGGDLQPVDLGAGFLVDQVRDTACARSGNEVKCWGLGTWTGLGVSQNIGDEPGEMGDELATIALGGSVTWLGDYCAYLEGGLKCWGGNAWGGLGLGDTEHRGDEPGEMGENLPIVDLGSVGALVDQCSGSGYRCALDEAGIMKCWGLNDRGMLGTEDYENRGDQPGEMGDSLDAIDLGTDTSAVQIACGRTTVCALLDDATLKCWGSNDQGELVDVFGDIFGGTWGGAPNQMGDALPEIVPDPERTVAEVQVGYDVVCVRFEDGAVKCWGDNAEGALGQGNEEWAGGIESSSAELPVIDLGTAEAAAQIAVGEAFACARLVGGRVKCWGQNDVGQLGYEDTEDRGDEPGEMGDALPYVRFF
jgi:cysteine-rich repeat protein